MSGMAVGALIGFAFAVVWMTIGFGPAVLCLAFAFIGWFVSALLLGRINLGTLWQEVRGTRTT